MYSAFAVVRHGLALCAEVNRFVVDVDMWLWATEGPVGLVKPRGICLHFFKFMVGKSFSHFEQLWEGWW